MIICLTEHIPAKGIIFRRHVNVLTSSVVWGWIFTTTFARGISSLHCLCLCNGDSRVTSCTGFMYSTVHCWLQLFLRLSLDSCHLHIRVFVLIALCETLLLLILFFLQPYATPLIYKLSNSEDSKYPCRIHLAILSFKLEDWELMPVRKKIFSLVQIVHTGFLIHSAPFFNGYRGSFPGGKAAGAWSFATYLPLAPRLRMSAIMHLLSLYAFMPWKGQLYI